MRKTAMSMMALLLAVLYTHAQMIIPDRDLREIHLTGNAYELGFQHGHQLKAEIETLIQRWKENVHNQTGMNADQLLKDFFDYADFNGAIEKWTPELLDELQGISEGSGQAFNDVFLLNLLDEFWVFLDDPENHHCSGIGVPAIDGRPAYIAQNMDLENYTDGMQVLMRIEGTPERPEQLVLTYPGLIGLNGLNELGVGVCVNTLMQLSASSDGLPVAFVIRHILSLGDKNNILSFINEVKHASGQNYIIGIRDKVIDLEASAGKVVRFDPAAVNGAVYHTNHPLVNDDLKSWHRQRDPGSNANSIARFESVSSRIGSYEVVTEEEIIETLRAKDNKYYPVCRPNLNDSRGFTFASVVMVLEDEPYMLVTSGPPNQSEYLQFYFTGSR